MAKQQDGKKKQTGPINEEPGQGYNPLSEGVFQELLKLARPVPPRELQPYRTQYYPPVGPQIGPNPEPVGTPYPGVFMDPVTYYAPGTPGPVGGVSMSYRQAMDLPNMTPEELDSLSFGMAYDAGIRQDILDRPGYYGYNAGWVPNVVAQPAVDGDPVDDWRFTTYPTSRRAITEYTKNMSDYMLDARRGYGPTIDDGTNPFSRGNK